MTTRRGLRTVLAGSLLLVAAACAQPTADAGPGVGGPGDGTGSLAADAPVLRVEYTGGFVTAAMVATRMPIVTVYGDGRVISLGPQIAIYPGPALPNVQVQRIATADVGALIDRARKAGVGSAKDLGQSSVADAPTTRFTVRDEEGTEVLEVYALNEIADDAPGLSPEQVDARRRARDLFAALTDLPGTLGAGRVSEPQAYVPTALVAVAVPWTGGDPGIPQQPDVPWPGPALPGESLGGPPLGCVTVTGAALAEVLAAAAKADTVTAWSSGGKRWTVQFRPLLPEESGCADVRASS